SVALLCAFDEDRAGQDVITGTSFLDLSVNVAQCWFDLVGSQPGAIKALGTRGDKRLDFDRVARFDAQHGGSLRIVISPHDCLRRRLELIDWPCRHCGLLRL